MSTYQHDPDAVLPYTVDWSAWLDSFTGTTPTIASHVIEADAGVTVESSTNDDTSVTAVISGGTAGEDYEVTFRAVLSSGPPYQDDRTIHLRVRER